MDRQIRMRAHNPAVYASAREQGFTHLQASILATRLDGSTADLDNLQGHVAPSLSALDAPWTLPDINAAVDRIVQAIMSDEILITASDFDCDGATSQCVLFTSLTSYFGVPIDRVKPYISHRMAEGYGVSDALVDRILAEVDGKAMMITADQGSADEPRIARLRTAGIDTVVTDHHLVPEEGAPASAVACVNPVRKDSRFPDPCIAGCHVAWLTMCAVRTRLIEVGHLPADAPKLTDMLDWVALGSQADCMDLAVSKNNRAIIRYGLWMINTNPRQCWRSLCELTKTDFGTFNSRDISFSAAPRINARGRLSEAMTSAEFLMSNDPERSMEMLLLLDEENKRRRVIQEEMTASGMDVAQAQFDNDEAAIVVFFAEGHSGVHGIVASKYIDLFGRPVVCFSPKPNHPGKLSGSFRSIPGIHIRDALAVVNLKHPEMLVSWGGHSGAAGCSLCAPDLKRFSEAFRSAVDAQSDGMDLVPVLLTDGEMEEPPSLQMLAEIAALEPYGRQFEAPVFSGVFIVAEVKPVGDGRHLRMGLNDAQGRRFTGIWFGARLTGEDDLPVSVGDRVQAVYILKPNHYRGRTTADMVLQQVQPVQDFVQEHS